MFGRHVIVDKALSALFVAWLAVFSANAVPDDTEIFVPPPGNPKVLFVLDASGSMRNRDNLELRRIERLKVAMQTLLADPSTTGVDIGLMEYSAPSGSAQDTKLLYPVSSVDENRAELIDAANSIITKTQTPTVAALNEAKLYLTGAAPNRGATFEGTAEYVSPVTGECDAANIVLLSDGAPTADAAIVNTLQTKNGYNCALVDVFANKQRGRCGVELVQDFFDNNQFGPDNDKTISTYTIGFSQNSAWLEDLAEVGGGLYRDALSTQDLVEVFQEILMDVSQSTVASAPAVPVSTLNESRDGNELYYTFFQSNTRPRWEGNVKKYLLEDGVIVDADANPLVVGGVVSPGSRSLWAGEADGRTVADGGMAALQPAVRQWYTDAGVTAEADNTIIPLLVTAATDITPESLGLPAGADVAPFVEWVMGTDSIDRNGNGDVTEPNHYVADSLHSSPVLITYSVNPAIDLNDRALFIANNMGVLHAIDPEDGTELWSYSPEELLPNIQAYVENESEDHVYGLDGQIVPHTSRSESADGTVVTDMARLYLSQRRGGNNIIALDVKNALSATDPFRVMWKISGDDVGFEALAQTWSTPQLINIKAGCPANCTTREVLMFSGGYNADVYDNKNLTYPVTPAAQGHGNAIYMVDPVTGELVWSAGDGAGYSLDIEIWDSVPETPVPVDNNADGAVDILFFSDIAGHVWRVDLDNNAAIDANGDLVDDADLAIDGGMIADLVEVGQTLRFFNRPDVVLTGTTIGLSSYSIVMGSGMRSSPLFEEPDNNRVFSFYDPWTFTHPVAINPLNGMLESEYNYVESASGALSVITPNELVEHGETYSNPDGGPFGFYRELAAGEKILEETLTTAGRIFLTSYAPLNDRARCEAVTGESRLYIFDLLNGDNLLPDEFGNPYYVLTEGIAPPLDIVDTGGASGPTVVAGKKAISLESLLEPDQPNTFRRFVRTGWIEEE